MCADSTGSPINCFNFGNLWRRLTLPAGIADWSLASLQLHLVKAGGRLIKTRAVLLADAGRRTFPVFATQALAFPAQRHI
jgi:hypothetical protein